MLQRYDEDSILRMIDKHSNMIYKICFVYLKNRFDAEDAFQELIIKIMEKAPHFLSDEHEKAWIIKVSGNHCKNVIKSKKLKNYIVYNDNITLNQPVVEDNTLEHILELPLRYRNVLYLYYYEGYSTREIALLLKRREATIRTRLRRARENLKIVIGGDYNE